MKIFAISYLSLMILTMGQACTEKTKEIDIEWTQFPQVPDPVGFAGAFGGISHDKLLTAGGANFPEGTRPWSGGIKQWNDKVWALDLGADTWKEVGRLPRPLGYGVSLTWNEKILIFGGADQQRHYEDVISLEYVDGKLAIDSLPPLPLPLANMSGAIIDDVVYLAGGLQGPTAEHAERIFCSLDLRRMAAGWQLLDTWPGSERMLALCGELDGKFYLCSGVALKKQIGDTTPTREYLRDAYRYLPGKGWETISSLPHAVAAAPGPAFSFDKGLVVLGGDDGSLALRNNELKDEHPGFQKDILVYKATTNQWETGGEVFTDKKDDAADNPTASVWAPVTATAMKWKGSVIIPMGEVRPGVRTNRVLVANFNEQ
ncbi:galactose oxidase [Olivibacter domesticus]|uniref:N-acetylneuraminic acid mutarotase n=1 Tax=Olivibacter domesticus TaxID=407022 RepID=A0A1H7XFM2_OLID1|nr:galactose oxidase [Olivibacter domesticus]SEM32473.1 hypothetical protein SAMN05661044_04874 [Olivibacter domesticus]